MYIYIYINIYIYTHIQTFIHIHTHTHTHTHTPRFSFGSGSAAAPYICRYVSSYYYILSPYTLGLVKGRDRGTPNGSALVRASKESGGEQKAALLSNLSDRNTGGWATRAKGTLEDAEDDEERREVEDKDFPPELEVLEKVVNVHDMQVVNDDDAQEDQEDDCERRGRDRHGHSELIKLGAAGAGKDQDSADRHRHSELIKLGAAGAGKSGKIGVCVTTRVTTSSTTSFTISG
jgi:hypothetical protein